MTGVPRFTPCRGRGSNRRRAFARLALTGLLVASPTVIGAAVPAVDSSRVELVRLIRDVAGCVGISPLFAEALARAESGLDPRAVSAKGALGLFQLLPVTAREMGVPERDVFDPAVNAAAGLRYFRRQAKRFDSIPLALVAYNAGPEVARRWTRDRAAYVPPETQRFVEHVLSIHRRLKRAAPEPRDPLREGGCDKLLPRTRRAPGIGR